ncbi:flagellar assembly protein FliW [Sulfuricella sp. T08]|uniref:flagellar assembly protein FliW n=1 Tax=Sulfuricella sp. T08 TaxID=1632857 RepID=UPI0006179D79|nr:flagellar assembly protein FliW [Sulfuricella sp. T08]GAO35972.1 flagellar assembly protein FliW [Sulfuricella sp. T08]
MKFHSTQFGMQEVDPESILTFPNGMPGFEGSTRYKLFHDDKEQQVVVHWLQSIDEPDVAFALVDPAVFGLNYEFVLTDEEEQLLKMENVDDIAVLLIAYKPQPDADSKTNINANINGPIVLNTRTRLGLQKILVGIEADLTLKSKKPAA